MAPVLTVTPSPTVTPAPTPSAAPAATPSQIDVSSATGENGVLQQDIHYSSADGALELEISSGTTALTGEGDPLKAIELQPVHDPPAFPTDWHVIGLAFDLGPHDATFDQPLKITSHYDPDLCPEGVAEESLGIAYYELGTGAWVELERKVDTVNHTISAEVSRLTLFAVIGEAAPPPVLEWWLILSIVVGVVFAGLAVLFMARSRSAQVS